ncbi:PAS domain-containing methyl-accepting chemotaxis protein [Roseovarius sp. THAF9]|uniref:PAS domain-containing protein n=1 Tax=Roseovarius sp. THAF9 TaxID=2587847 RepID=UPI0020C82318|nr:PAS domain-containing methyl-accepting chemotaxis protein [Roseovarius sp. THAF9]
MFGKRKQDTKARGDVEFAQALVSVIDRAQAVIEFTPDGTILSANENFLHVLGYSLDEIAGQHHAMFVTPDYAQSEEYRAFWTALAKGEFFTDQFPRVSKTGEIVWISATYAPVISSDGTVEKVIKVATDVTARRLGIERMAEALKGLSDGDLEHEVAPCGVTDIDRLGDAFNAAAARLSEAIISAKEVAGTVERTASEVGEASIEMSNRTENQAATLERRRPRSRT